MADGAELIAAERRRQVEQEGWTPEHDDQWGVHQMLSAADAYIEAGRALYYGQNPMRTHAIGKWPWDMKWFKPGDDAIRCLTKAGALIAAEIDRLQRERAAQPTS